MQKRRFNLPPLDLIQGFEAAARNLSFTKAAEELFITQSAVSRQIRALEEHLSVALFERRHRALVLTEQGRILQRAATELLERLQEVTDRLRRTGATRDTHRHDHQWLRLAVAHSPPARVHGAAARRRRAHLGHLQGDQSRAQPGRRGGAPVRAGGRAGGRRAAVRRGAVSRLQPGLARRGAARLAHAAGPGAPRAAAHARGGRIARLGHLAGGAGVRRPQARRVAQVRRLRADDRRGAERPGRRHGHRPPRQRAAGRRAGWWRRSPRASSASAPTT